MEQYFTRGMGRLSCRCRPAPQGRRACDRTFDYQSGFERRFSLCIYFGSRSSELPPLTLPQGGIEDASRWILGGDGAKRTLVDVGGVAILVKALARRETRKNIKELNIG